MKRRNFLQLAAAAAATAPSLLSAPARSQLTMLPGPGMPQTPAPDAGGKADVTLRIAPVTVELSPNRILSTIGYNGTSPGPILRMPAGKPISVDVVNATDTPELVHWHGFLIPGDVDGVEEQGTPFVPPLVNGTPGHRRYTFTPGPTGLRWYHSHAMAMSDLHKGAYTGQFGFVVVEGPDPGAYDQEVFLALRDWEPFFASLMADTDEEDDPNAPQPEKPQVLNTDANGIEVNSMTYSINDKSLGSGEPIRVKEGQRVLFRVLNASAIENRRLSLPGHKFKILALDGNPVPNPALVETLFLGAGERIDALVEMTNPGIWIMGAPEDPVRDAGLGVVVEYAGQHKSPQWIKPADLHFDYTAFGNAPNPGAKAPDATIEMIFEKIPRGAGKFNLFTINGKSYPHENEFVLKQGLRYRLVMRNRTDDAHPMHLHRHQLELVDINGKKTSGVIKDTVIVPFYGRATVDFTADQPGLTLFHCHIQQHMDFGFKALFRYS